MARAVGHRHLDALRIGKSGATGNHIHAVAFIKPAAQLHLGAYHTVGFAHQGVVVRVCPVIVTRDLLNGVTQRLARNCTAMRA